MMFSMFFIGSHNEASTLHLPLLAASKYLLKQLIELELSATSDNGSAIFMIDKNPDNKTKGDRFTIPCVIICRIFPRSAIYADRAYQIEINFPPSYPLSPPEVRFLTPIYHPNVDNDGK